MSRSSRRRSRVQTLEEPRLAAPRNPSLPRPLSPFLTGRSEPHYRSNVQATLPTALNRLQRLLRLAQATTPPAAPLRGRSEPFRRLATPSQGRHVSVVRRAASKQLHQRTDPVPMKALGIRVPNKVKFCLQRRARREVLHALNKVGRGSGRGPRRRTQNSQYRC